MERWAIDNSSVRQRDSHKLHYSSLDQQPYLRRVRVTELDPVGPWSQEALADLNRLDCSFADEFAALELVSPCNDYGPPREVYEGFFHLS